MVFFVVFKKQMLYMSQAYRNIRIISTIMVNEFLIGENKQFKSFLISLDVKM